MTDVTIEPVRDGDLALILLGFVAPTGDGYIHFVAVRDNARGLGLGRRLYDTFTAAAVARGATGLKALTSPSNERSVAFHRRMGFTEMTLEEDYAGQWPDPRGHAALAARCLHS